jgi:putative peptidoglycan lipid II flippase
VQWPALRKEGFRFGFELAPRDSRVREVLLLMIPSTVGLAAVQINLFVNTLLATGEGTGAVAVLNYSFRLMYLPIGLFGVSVASASLPSLSADANRGDLPGMRRTLSAGMRLMLMLNVPATIGLMALATPNRRADLRARRLHAPTTRPRRPPRCCATPRACWATRP